MRQKQTTSFFFFFGMFLLGMIILAFVPANGEGLMGFLASLFTIGGTLGMLLTLWKNRSDVPQNPTEEP